MYKSCILFICGLIITTLAKEDSKNHKCPENERFVQCDAICNARTCREAGYTVPCNRNGTCPGKAGCICDDGYLRDDDGVCIPKQECPSCDGDDNAIPGCGNPCGKVCHASKRKKRCATYCLANGCDCKEDYVLNKSKNKCVLPKDC